MPLQSYVLDLIENRRSSVFLKTTLLAFSQAYRMGVYLRNWAYDAHLLKTQSVPVPVISIGNISVGGTGKTPLVSFIANHFLKQRRIAILSRGYKSQVEKMGLWTEVNADSLPEVCGDEACFLAKSLPNALVFSGKKRSQTAEQAVAKGAELILLDDGMQHRSLKRDFEIAVMDRLDPLGKGYYLPRGFLRDCPKRLREVDLIVVNSVECDEEIEEIKEKISFHTDKPLVGMNRVVMNAEAIKGKKVAAFCAIARPERFFSTLMHENAEIIDRKIGMDHDCFSLEELKAFAKNARAKGAEMLVCTEKDAIKLRKTDALALPIIVIRTKLMITSGEKHWNAWIHMVETDINRRRNYGSRI